MQNSGLCLRTLSWQKKCAEELKPRLVLNNATKEIIIINDMHVKSLNSLIKNSFF